MDLEELMQQQEGLVTRAQVLALGLGDGFIDTRLRRKDWRRVHRGVFIDHTGPLTWRQEVWAALLFYGEADGRAAACERSALGLWGLEAPDAGDEAAAGGATTLRLGWRQVLDRPDPRLWRKFRPGAGKPSTSPWIETGGLPSRGQPQARDSNRRMTGVAVTPWTSTESAIVKVTVAQTCSRPGKSACPAAWAT